MLVTIAGLALILCVLNWLLFVGITLLKDLPDLKRALDALLHAPPHPDGAGLVKPHTAVDPVELAKATGNLAAAFKKAGPAPTAAALSVLFLLVALAAAGLGRI